MDDDLKKRRSRNRADEMVQTGWNTAATIGERIRELGTKEIDAGCPVQHVATMFITTGMMMLDEAGLSDDEIAAYLEMMLTVQKRVIAGEDAKAVALEMGREIAEKHGL